MPLYRVLKYIALRMAATHGAKIASLFSTTAHIVSAQYVSDHSVDRNTEYRGRKVL